MHIFTFPENVKLKLAPHVRPQPPVPVLRKGQNFYLVSKHDNLAHVIGPERANQPQIARTASVGKENDLRNFFGAAIGHKKPPEMESFGN